MAITQVSKYHINTIYFLHIWPWPCHC